MARHGERRHSEPDHQSGDGVGPRTLRWGSHGDEQGKRGEHREDGALHPLK
jgi:hypothetical protein